MSRSPTDGAVSAPPSRWREAGSLVGAWRRPVQSLFVQPEGLWSLPGTRRGAPDDTVVPTFHADIDAWCRTHRDAPARLVLSGRLTVDLSVDTALPLNDEPTLAAWTRHQLVEVHGPEAAHWPLVAWCEGVQRGATALSGLDLPAWRARASRHGVRLVGARPWWSVAVAALSRQQRSIAGDGHGAVALVEGRAVTWLRLRHGALVELQQRWLDAATAAALDALLAGWVREAAAAIGAGAPALRPWVIGHGLEDGGGVDGGTPLRHGERLGDLRGAVPAETWWGTP